MVLVVEVVLVLVDSTTAARGFRRIEVMVLLLVVVVVFVSVLVAYRRAIRGFSTAAFSASRIVGTGAATKTQGLGTPHPNPPSSPAHSSPAPVPSAHRAGEGEQDCLLLIALLVGV